MEGLPDLDRWFNELSHKYVELVSWLSIHCHFDLMMQLTFDYQNTKERLSVSSLQQFSTAIREIQKGLESGSIHDGFKVKIEGICFSYDDNAPHLLMFNKHESK